MKSRVFVFTGFILIPLFFSASVFAIDPANPNANDTARAILNFLDSQTGQKEKRLISGQFLEFEAAVSTKLLTAIHDQTGQYVAMAGADYMDWPSGGIRWTKSNAALKDAWRSGCIVHVCVHIPNPNGGKFNQPDFDLNTLFEEGTQTHTRWFGYLDDIADGLRDLQEAGVVVLFRPLHEMNGHWFWWGDEDPDLYRKVWRQLFDYYTNTKKLNNLLWVFGPNIGNAPADYYPGDEYCDIVGLDAYTSKITLSGIEGYEEMALLPKPFGLTEYGPGGAKGCSGDFDYRILVDGLKNQMPRICFVLAWSGPWAISNNCYAREALNDPYVANRDDITAAFGPAAVVPAQKNNPSMKRKGLK